MNKDRCAAYNEKVTDEQREGSDRDIALSQNDVNGLTSQLIDFHGSGGYNGFQVGNNWCQCVQCSIFRLDVR